MINIYIQVSRELTFNRHSLIFSSSFKEVSPKSIYPHFSLLTAPNAILSQHHSIHTPLSGSLLTCCVEIMIKKARLSQKALQRDLESEIILST